MKKEKLWTTLTYLVCAMWGIVVPFTNMEKNWARSSFVGGGVSGELKITVSHPSKGVKNQLDT